MNFSNGNSFGGAVNGLGTSAQTIGGERPGNSWMMTVEPFQKSGNGGFDSPPA